jgi:hypothetical protein
MFLIHVQMDENDSRRENVPLEVHSLFSFPQHIALEREREEEGTTFSSISTWMKFTDDD